MNRSRKIVRVAIGDDGSDDALSKEEEKEESTELDSSGRHSCSPRASYRFVEKQPLNVALANDIIENETDGLFFMYPIPEAVQHTIDVFWKQIFKTTLQSQQRAILEVIKRRWPLYHSDNDEMLEEIPKEVLSSYRKYLVEPVIQSLQQTIEEEADYSHFYVTLELLKHLFIWALSDVCLLSEDANYVLHLLHYYDFDKKKLIEWYSEAYGKGLLRNTPFHRWYKRQTQKQLVSLGRGLKSPCNQSLLYKTNEFTEALRRLVYLRILLQRLYPIECRAEYEQQLLQSLQQLAEATPWGAMQLLVYRRKGRDYYTTLLNIDKLQTATGEAILENLELFTVPFRYDSLRRSLDIKTVTAGRGGQTFAVTSLQVDPSTEIKHDSLTTIFLPVSSSDHNPATVRNKIRNLERVLDGNYRRQLLQNNVLMVSMLSSRRPVWSCPPLKKSDAQVKTLLSSGMTRYYTSSQQQQENSSCPRYQQQSYPASVSVTYSSLLSSISSQINNANVDRDALQNFINSWLVYVRQSAPLPMNANVTPKMRKFVFKKLQRIIKALAQTLWKYSSGKYRLVLYPGLTSLYIVLVFLRWSAVEDLLTAEQKDLVEELWEDFENAALAFEQDPRSCTVIPLPEINGVRTDYQHLVRIYKNTEAVIKMKYNDIKNLAQKYN